MKIKEEKKENVFEKNVNDFFNLIFINYFNQQLHKNKNILEDNINVPRELEMDLHEYSGFFFGMASDQTKYVGKPADKDGHILVIGFPGSGKTMAIVIPTMYTWRGFQIIIDVKGDLYKYWKLLNQNSSKKVFLFKPSAFKENKVRYDPFTFLRYGGSDYLVGNAKDLALALIPLMPSVKEPIWIETAQNFLIGSIIYYFDLGSSFNDMMVEIQSLSVIETIDLIMNSNNKKARLFMCKLKGVQEKVIENIGMELARLSTLVTDPAIINAFSHESECELLDWFELNTTSEPFDVILEIPEANFEKWEPMIKLMINQLIKALEHRSARAFNKDNELLPVLIMLDEFPRLGMISAIKNGLGTLRSHGVTIAIIVQSFANLEEIYGEKTAKVIADNCTYKVILGVSDPSNQKYFSEAVGTIESLQNGINVNFDPFYGRFSGMGLNINETRKPIKFPHEFLTLTDVIMLIPFNGFYRVNKILFYKHSEIFIKSRTLQKQLDFITPEGGSNND